MWPFGKKPEYDAEKTNLGSILKAMGLLVDEQIHGALLIQGQQNGKIGALLIEHGAITKADLKRALEVQEKLRTGREVEANLDLALCRIDERKKTNTQMRAVTMRLEAMTGG